MGDAAASSSSEAPSVEPEKENDQGPPKRPRKSIIGMVGDGRRKSVTFGHVTEVEIPRNSPEPSPAALRYMRRTSLTTITSPAAAAEAAAAMQEENPYPCANGSSDLAPPPPPAPPAPAPPPPSAPVAAPPALTALPPLLFMPAASAIHAAPPASTSVTSPTPSVASSAADVFYSPAETFESAYGEGGTPQGDHTPTLGGLLEEDRLADEGVPALGSLLEEDVRAEQARAAAAGADEEATGMFGGVEADVAEDTMDLTVAVGGIFRNASAGNTLAQAAFASVAAAVALEEEEPTMDMTVAVGGILRTAASVATPAAAAPSTHTAAASSSMFTPDPSALATDNGYGDEFGVTPGRLSGVSARVGVASAGGASTGAASGGTPGWLKEATVEVRRLSVAPATLGHVVYEDEEEPESAQVEQDDEEVGMEMTGAYEPAAPPPAMASPAAPPPSCGRTSSWPSA